MSSQPPSGPRQRSLGVSPAPPAAGVPAAPLASAPYAAALPAASASLAPASIIPSPVDRAELGRWTAARVALGRAGCSLPTKAHLDFLHDHARARDAVWTAVDFDDLASRLAALGVTSVRVRSQARDRAEYLRRPDFGRLLDEAGDALLSQRGARVQAAVVVADGLSAQAVHSNAVAVIESLLPQLEGAGVGVGPVVLVEQGRVAVGDPIAMALGADVVIVLIGERPGLSAADSLGCYLTWSPRLGTADSARNCISNIRAGGLAPVQAARKIAWLACEAMRRRVGGLALKEAAPPLLPVPGCDVSR